MHVTISQKEVKKELGKKYACPSFVGKHIAVVYCNYQCSVQNRRVSPQKSNRVVVNHSL